MNKEVEITPQDIAKALNDLLEEKEQLQEKINKAIGYANERINYCCHNGIDTTDWEEIFEILGDK